MATILTYHHIAEVTAGGRKPDLHVDPEAFDRQLRYLKEAGYTVLTLDDLHSGLRGEAPLPRKAVALTFDDGYANNHAEALPILDRHGFRATFFVTTGWIDGTGENGERCMTAREIRELDAAGMTIGSHTVSHPWLGRLEPQDVRRELEDSKNALEDVLGKQVRWLCYPSGSFNRGVISIAEELGYDGACSAIRDNRVRSNQIYYLPRVMVMHGATAIRFRYYFSAPYHWTHAWKNRKRWGRYL